MAVLTIALYEGVKETHNSSLNEYKDIPETSRKKYTRDQTPDKD